jgi:Fe-coproporphyrin III synthase
MPVNTSWQNSLVELKGSRVETENEKISGLPILLLNVHEHCNCHCLMCDIWKRKDGAELDLTSFARQRESLLRLGVKNVVLTGGEPLLHSHFEALCGFLKETGVRITLLTTGLLLSKRAEVVARLVDEVIISLDGPEELHDEVRRVKGAYQLISEGVQAVKRINAASTFHGRSTVQKANHAMLRRTVSAAKALQFDSISFLAVDATSQAFNRELVWPGEKRSQIMLTSVEIAALESEIEALTQENAEDFRSHFIRESETKLKGIARRFREYLGELTPVAPRCNAPWVSAVLEVDGSVRPCFFHQKIGSVEDKPLFEVINGEPARTFRASLNVDENPTCQRCVCSLNYPRNAVSNSQLTDLEKTETMSVNN